MAVFHVPYGKSTLGFRLPDEWEVRVIRPGSADVLDDLRRSAADALSGLGERWCASLGRRSVAVAINDKTRPVPHEALLPALEDWLIRSGYRREEIIYVIANGAHDPMRSTEYHQILPPEFLHDRQVLSHDATDRENLVHLGVTGAGTPCVVNSVFASASLKIVVGNIEPHQFVGWSGGVKTAAIGLAGIETITANHAMLTREGAAPCRFGDNPVRRDIEELGSIIGIDLALNVVMNEDKETVGVFAGSPEDVMRRGIGLAGRLYSVSGGSESADLVIAAPGGHPKDINLYQAQKALRHGARAAAPGAPVILVAACPDGIGSEAYRRSMDGVASHADVKSRFGSSEFRLGPHKAVLFALDADGRDVYLVSNLSDGAVRPLLLESARSVEDAVERIRRRPAARGGRPFRVVILPWANATVPMA